MAAVTRTTSQHPVCDLFSRTAGPPQYLLAYLESTVSEIKLSFTGKEFVCFLSNVTSRISSSYYLQKRGEARLRVALFIATITLVTAGTCVMDV